MYHIKNKGEKMIDNIKVKKAPLVGEVPPEARILAGKILDKAKEVLTPQQKKELKNIVFNGKVSRD